MQKGNTYLLLDSRIVNKTENLQLKPVEAAKCKQNPLFAEDMFADPPRRWEARFDNFYPNVIYDEEEKLYKLWYNSFIRDRSSETTPLESRSTASYDTGGREDGLLYAVSKDGLVWETPSLGIVSFDGDTGNNIVMSTKTHGIHGVGVIKDLADPDLERRYKAFYRHADTKKMATGYSRDGLHWSEPADWPDYNALGDTHNNVIRIAGTDTFVGITRGLSGESPNRYRTVMRTTSTDFVNWSDPLQVLAGNSIEDQIYSIPIHQYKNVYIGLPAIYHGGDKNAENWDLVDTELAWSSDTITWNRICPGTPVIPRGRGTYPSGAYDCGCIYAAAPVVVDDSIYLYYGGSNGLHTSFRETFFCLAILPRDRFAGYSPIDPGGRGILHTNQFRISDDFLKINTDAAEGSLSVALMNDEGRIIDGCSHEDCTIQQHGSIEKQVSWSRSLSTIKGQKVSFQIQLGSLPVFALSGQITSV